MMFMYPAIAETFPFITKNAKDYNDKMAKFTKDFVQRRRLNYETGKGTGNSGISGEKNDFTDAFLEKILETTEKNDVNSNFYGETGCKTISHFHFKS